MLAIYAPVAGYSFINYDDDLYVTRNPVVQRGLTGDGLAWALTSVKLYYWQPLTWLSHMLDCQLFGLDAGPPHAVNVAFHAANTLLFFLLLARLTRAFWPAALAAALFALHPLRVESVAWVAERKDVLSAFWFLLTLWAYRRYTAQPGWRRYLLLCAAFALAVMSKPTVVSLPFLLLLLDFWPLGRLSLSGPILWARLVEKIPLFAMSAIGSILTYLGQDEMRAVSMPAVGLRLANAAVSYLRYLELTFYPHDLAILYPYRRTLGPGEVVGAILVLAVITAGVVHQARRRPYLAAGWFWFVIGLAPTIGLVQAGPQAMADRFTYLPSLGLSVLLVWGLWEAAGRLKHPRAAVAATAGVVLPLLAWQSAVQVRVWRDSVTVFSRAATLAPEDPLIQHDLGYALAEAGRSEEAIPHYRAALALDSANFRAHYNLGRALAERGQTAEAAAEFKQVLRFHPAPDFAADAHNALAIVLARQGRPAEAEPHFREAVRLKPNSPELHNNLGSLLAQRGALAAAVTEFAAAIRLSPGYAEAHRNLGHALAQLGRRPEALAEFQKVLELNPGDRDAARQVELLQAR